MLRLQGFELIGRLYSLSLVDMSCVYLEGGGAKASRHDSAVSWLRSR